MAFSSDRRAILLKGQNRSYLYNTRNSLISGLFDVEVTLSEDDALRRLEERTGISAIIFDLRGSVEDGLDFLRSVRRVDTNLPILVLSDEASPLKIVEATKAGADDYLSEPFSGDELSAALDRAIASKSHLAAGPTPSQSSRMYYGNHPAMREYVVLAPRVAASDLPVLIQGETGTGKEAMARELHSLSRRSRGPFLKLNCAAVPSELIESELFGYEKGAFTGALQRKLGMFELASGGTILLDEIGDMDVRLQAKLLHVLQDHQIWRLGGKSSIPVDVRLIAATHRDLDKGIANGNFREDLFYRLNVFTFTIPSLRARREDIPELARILLRRHMPQEFEPAVLTPALERAMMDYDWPGNIRELENVIRRYNLLRDPEYLLREFDSKSSRHLRSVAVPKVAEVPLSRSTHTTGSSNLRRVSEESRQAERETIEAALVRTRWNRKQAARLLEIDYRALLYKMKKLGIEGRAQGNEDTENRVEHAGALAG